MTNGRMNEFCWGTSASRESSSLVVLAQGERWPLASFDIDTEKSGGLWSQMYRPVEVFTKAEGAVSSHVCMFTHTNTYLCKLSDSGMPRLRATPTEALGVRMFKAVWFLTRKRGNTLPGGRRHIKCTMAPV